MLHLPRKLEGRFGLSGFWFMLGFSVSGLGFRSVVCVYVYIYTRNYRDANPRFAE